MSVNSLWATRSPTRFFSPLTMTFPTSARAAGIAVMMLLLLLASPTIIERVDCVSNPMPFRNGYGLGSWIPDVVVSSMKNEAEIRGEIFALNNMEAEAQSLSREISLLKNPVKNPHTSEQEIPTPIEEEEASAYQDRLKKTRSRLFSKKFAAYQDLVELLEKDVDNLQSKRRNRKSNNNNNVDAARADDDDEEDEAAGSDPYATPTTGGFTTFACAVESPVEWHSSRVGSAARGYDSIFVDASYVEVGSSIQDANSKNSHANNVAGNISSAIENMFGASKSISQMVSKQAAEKVVSTMSGRSLEATLILTAFATHRNIRQFDVLTVNADKARAAWNHFNYFNANENQKNSKKQQQNRKKRSHRDDDNDNDNSEGDNNEYVGSSSSSSSSSSSPFNTMHIPHPRDETEAFKRFMDRALNETAKEKLRGRLSLVSELYMGSTLVGLVHFVNTRNESSTQSYERTQESAEFSKEAMRKAKMLAKESGNTKFSNSQAQQLAKLASDSGLDVHFDLVSVGFIPRLKVNHMETALDRFNRFDPAAFDAGLFSGTDSEASTTNTVTEQARRQSNMASVINAIVHSVNEVASENPVLTTQSFMDAFDDFCLAAQQSNKEMGAPIGINVRHFTKLDVLRMLAEKHLGAEY